MSAAVRAVVVPAGGLPYETELQRDAEGSVADALRDIIGSTYALFDPLSEDLGGVDLYQADLFARARANRAVYATASIERAGYVSTMDMRSPSREGELYTILLGDVVAVGYDPETGESVSLVDEQVARVTDYFTRDSPPGSGDYEVLRIQNPALAEYVSPSDFAHTELPYELDVAVPGGTYHLTMSDQER
jgi:hypothetical protein